MRGARAIGRWHGTFRREEAGMIGRADLIKGAGAALLAVAARPVSAKKKKKKRYPKPPRCPESCSFLFHGPIDEDICGIANNLQVNGGQCVPCGPETACVDAAFPHRLNSVTNLANNEISYFTNLCGAYEFGVCGLVVACVTKAP
jgi:hypothetical protein